MKLAFKWAWHQLQRLSVDQRLEIAMRPCQIYSAWKSQVLKWITIIIAINTTGSVLPPQIIFAGKNHQSQWYSAIPEHYRISMSNNGWTNDGIGLEWLQKMFEKHARPS